MNRRDFLRRTTAHRAPPGWRRISTFCRSPRTPPPPTTRRSSACSCTAASTATTCWSRSTPPAMRVRGRAQRDSGIQLTQSALLPISPLAANTYTPFGLHPSLAELKTLFDGGKLARARERRHADAADHEGATTSRAGVPTISSRIRTSRASGRARCASGVSRTGWGGRLADAIAPSPVSRLSGGHVDRGRHAVRDRRDVESARDSDVGHLRAGRLQHQRRRAGRGSPRSTRCSVSTATTRSSPRPPTSRSRRSRLPATVNPILTSTTSSVAGAFGGLTSSIARQLLTVAKMIEARARPAPSGRSSSSRSAASTRTTTRMHRCARCSASFRRR